MIPPVEWKINEVISNPFMMDHPLRITFHTNSLKDVNSGEELEALMALKELSCLKSSRVEALQTTEGLFHDIEFLSLDWEYLNEDKSNQFGFFINPKNDLLLKKEIIKFYGSLENEVALIQKEGDFIFDTLLDDLKEAIVYRYFGQHIFVTNSNSLLSLRNIGSTVVSNLNPRTPLEASRLVGLFLRSQNIFTYSVSIEPFIAPGKIGNLSLNNRYSFYEVLVRSQIPSIWTCLDACKKASKFRNDNIYLLASSILSRATRIFQALDEIGYIFHQPISNTNSNLLMYHFDYLNLLLLSLFDILARLIFRTYKNLSNHKFDNERDVDFLKKEFKKFLNHSPAQSIFLIIDTPDFKDTLNLIKQFRNNIHGAALTSMAYGKDLIAASDILFVELSRNLEHSDIQSIEKKLLNLGGLEEWGVIKVFDFTLLEPYTFSRNLVKTTFEIVNSLLETIDFNNLFPPEYSPQIFASYPSESKLLGEEMRQRLSVLI